MFRVKTSGRKRDSRAERRGSNWGVLKPQPLLKRLLRQIVLVMLHCLTQGSDGLKNLSRAFCYRLPVELLADKFPSALAHRLATFLIVQKFDQLFGE